MNHANTVTVRSVSAYLSMYHANSCGCEVSRMLISSSQTVSLPAEAEEKCPSCGKLSAIDYLNILIEERRRLRNVGRILSPAIVLCFCRFYGAF